MKTSAYYDAMSCSDIAPTSQTFELFRLMSEQENIRQNIEQQYKLLEENKTMLDIYKARLLAAYINDNPAFSNLSQAIINIQQESDSITHVGTFNLVNAIIHHIGITQVMTLTFADNTFFTVICCNIKEMAKKDFNEMDKATKAKYKVVCPEKNVCVPYLTDTLKDNFCGVDFVVDDKTVELLIKDVFSNRDNILFR